nr:unnamed protein product [Spirometra erinaceieuropaei]
MADEYADLKLMLQQQLKPMEALTDDAWKVRLLLRKLGPAEHERYATFILPKNPREVAFKDTVETLSQIFGEQSSLFNTRFQCLQLCKRDSDDFITYASIANFECGRFQPGSLTKDQFKCLMFICGLQSLKDADIRTRLLSKVQQNNSITLQELAAECQMQINLKHDSAMTREITFGFNVNSTDDTRCSMEISNFMSGIQSSQTCYYRENLLTYRLEADWRCKFYGPCH